MIRVHVSWHKDGDHVNIVRSPWWTAAYERIVNALFCPCCGLSGFLSRMQWYEVLTYRVWSRLLNVTVHMDKELLSIPIESGCVAAQKIWGIHDFCWRDDCEVPQ
jgi:hypothetical protein